MSFKEKSLECSDCGTAFTFTAEEQEFHQSKGYANEPKRCPECRRARKLANGNSLYRTPRQMFPATCHDCGKNTEVPFQPVNDRPVYCSDCYLKVRSDRW